FIDFIYPGFNQLVTNISTLRWRSFGNWKCPAVFYAPYGAYLPGGSLWHSQANESVLAHYPGLSVVIPSTPEDAAGLLWTAMHGEDPIIFLIPKHLLWAERESAEPIRAVPFGQARKRTDGSDVTLVAWGNAIEKSLEAIARIDDDARVELLDLRSIVPWDEEAVEKSVRKSRRSKSHCRICGAGISDPGYSEDRHEQATRTKHHRPDHGRRDSQRKNRVVVEKTGGSCRARRSTVRSRNRQSSLSDRVFLRRS